MAESPTPPTALHWFPIYVSDWLSSPAVSMMLPEQEGAYLRLLLASWGKGDKEPSLPIDETQLAQMSKLAGRWRKLGALVLEQFERRGDRYVHARLVAIWWEQQEKYAVIVRKASAGGKAKAAKLRASSTATGSAPGSASSTPQEELGLPFSLPIQNTEGAVEPQPSGLGVLPAPASGDALAPGGAALPAAGNGSNGTGDYLDRPGAREELARRGYRPPEEGESFSRERFDASAAERAMWESRYEASLGNAATTWLQRNPDDAESIERQQRLSMGLPPTGALARLPTEAVRANVVRAVRERLQWPTCDQWIALREAADAAPHPANSTNKEPADV